MTFILSSPAAAPAAPASAGSRAPARSGGQDPGQPGSFGEAMARSREAGQEKAAEPAVRPAPSKPVRRPANDEKAPAPDSVNPMAGLLAVPLESRLVAAAMPDGAAAAIAAGPAGNPKIPADAGLNGLNGLPAAAPAAPAAPAGLAGASGIVLDTDARAVLVPGFTAAASQGTDLAPAREAVVSNGMAMASNPLAQAVPASDVVTVAPIGTDLAPAPAREPGTSNGMPVAADPRAVIAQADAAGAGQPDSSSGQGGDGLDSAAAAHEGRAEAPLQGTDTAFFTGTGALAVPAGAALQQPGSLAAQNAPVASALLAPDVGSSEWGKALGQQVIHLSAADRQVAELQLNPPGLGPLKVTLSMNDHQMQAAFVSAHSSVRTAVEAALPQLRALLAENGISLGQTSVGADSQSQTAFANGQGDAAGSPPRASYRGREADKAALLFSAQPAAAQRRIGQGLRIDTYA
jgi:flagellar hook-length control protein FliK